MENISGNLPLAPCPYSSTQTRSLIGGSGVSGMCQHPLSGRFGHFGCQARVAPECIPASVVICLTHVRRFLFH